ncbi:hypothetical protein ACFPZL_05855 [Leucobacter soli]|uniref:Multidrug ABC transporter ATPase n=1 Tax=Leucobacter soli TaxID=2812850 RepID=A0A916K2I8_9MICO|nr:hypothetical protein [Leucobacter soli]CAG7620767.1 hypothetical protein LEUCIP111803_02388 [Leucobacter soli]
MPTDESPKFTLVERLLAYTSISIIGVAVLSYLVTLIVGLSGGRELLADGLWQVVTWIAFYGLPIGFVLLIALLVISFTRRGRTARGAARE